MNSKDVRIGGSYVTQFGVGKAIRITDRPREIHVRIGGQGVKTLTSKQVYREADMRDEGRRACGEPVGSWRKRAEVGSCNFCESGTISTQQREGAVKLYRTITYPYEEVFVVRPSMGGMSVRFCCVCLRRMQVLADGESPSASDRAWLIRETSMEKSAW